MGNAKPCQASLSAESYFVHSLACEAVRSNVFPVSNALLLVAVFAGLVASAVPRHAGRILGIAAGCAVALAGITLSGRPVELGGMSLIGIAPLALVLTTGMGATVLAFAGRNLRHEPYQRSFARLGSLLVTATSVVVVADNLVLLVIAWIATSALTVALLRTGPEHGREARSVRAWRSFVVGDAALVVAVGLLLSGRAPVIAGLLVLVAAASRSASGPFYRWLPASVGAPTPSSALLHAGVVNGGAILLIKLGPEVGSLVPVAIATAVVGGLSCIFAEAVMLTRPDVKGRLAWSTIAQMGFTMLLCGLGLPLAAGLHLVAHGFYKGALFLGSGSSVRALTRSRRSPFPVHRRGATAFFGAGSVGLAYLVPMAAIGGAVGATDAPWSAQLAVPLLLATVAAGQAGRAALSRTASVRGGFGALAATGALAGLYAALTVGLDGALHDQWPHTTPALSVLWVAPVLAALAVVAGTQHRHRAPASVEARAWAAVRRIGRPGLIHTGYGPGPAADRRLAASQSKPRHRGPEAAAPVPPDLTGALA